MTMGWSDSSKNARGGRGRQRAKTKEEQRIFDLNFGLRPKFFTRERTVENCQELAEPFERIDTELIHELLRTELNQN